MVSRSLREPCCSARAIRVQIAADEETYCRILSYFSRGAPARLADGYGDDGDDRSHAAARARRGPAPRRRTRRAAPRLERDLAATLAAEEAERRSLQVLEAIASGTEAGAAAGDPLDNASTVLAGAPLRGMIMRVALRLDRVGRPSHWRTWYGWLRDAGYDATGKKPEATFRDQLTRSPLVARHDQDGVYLLDVERFTAVKLELQDLHEQLTRLPPPDQLSMLGETRARRQRLQIAIGRCERTLSEMWEVLSRRAALRRVARHG